MPVPPWEPAEAGTSLRLASVFVPHCGTTPGQAGGQASNIEFLSAGSNEWCFFGKKGEGFRARVI
jgi:hypothetical protein